MRTRINGNIWFIGNLVVFVLFRSCVDKTELGTKAICLDGMDLEEASVSNHVRGKRRTNSSSFCETDGWEKASSFVGRSFGAFGTKSERNSSTGIGPTNFSLASMVISL